MTSLISRFRPQSEYRPVSAGTFAIEDDDEYGARGGEGQVHEESSLLGEPIERITVMLRRAESLGFGFIIAKESIVELKLQGWKGTHLMDLLSYAEEGGVYIGSVITGSPADEAKIQRWDVIQKVNGQDIKTWTQAEVVALIKSTQDILTLEILRNRDTPMREAQVQWDYVKDPLHKIRKGLMNALSIQPQ